MWRCGNLEVDGRQYIYEIVVAEFPSKLGIYSGKIVLLELYDDQNQIIANYDKKWIVAPEKGSLAYKLVSNIL